MTAAGKVTGTQVGGAGSCLALGEHGRGQAEVGLELSRSPMGTAECHLLGCRGVSQELQAVILSLKR